MALDLVLFGNTPLTSPYVMSVFVALHEKGLPFEFKQLNLERGEQLSEPFISQSITNRVPVLAHGDFWLAESSAITEYLDERFPSPEYPALYPANLEERARARMLQALIRSDFLVIREERSTETIFQRAPTQPLTPRAEKAKARLLRIAQQVLVPGKPYVGSAFSIADVDLSTMLMRLVANGDQTPSFVADYARGVWRRPSVQKWLAQTDYRET